MVPAQKSLARTNMTARFRSDHCTFSIYLGATLIRLSPVTEWVELKLRQQTEKYQAIESPRGASIKLPNY